MKGIFSLDGHLDDLHHQGAKEDPHVSGEGSQATLRWGGIAGLASRLSAGMRQVTSFCHSSGPVGALVKAAPGKTVTRTRPRPRAN